MGSIANHVRILHIDIKGLASLSDQAGAGLSAITGHTVWGNLSIGVMRAEIDAVKGCTIFLYESFHLFMHPMNQVNGKISPRHPGLVAHDDGEIAGLIE